MEQDWNLCQHLSKTIKMIEIRTHQLSACPSLFQSPTLQPNSDAHTWQTPQKLPDSAGGLLFCSLCLFLWS